MECRENGLEENARPAERKPDCPAAATRTPHSESPPHVHRHSTGKRQASSKEQPASDDGSLRQDVWNRNLPRKTPTRVGPAKPRRLPRPARLRGCEEISPSD